MDLKIQFNEHCSYPVIAETDQSIYLPNPNAPVPSSDLELFIGNIPIDISDELLISLFSRVGRFYKLRRMLDNFGHNKAYAYVTYNDVEDANKAVLHLHDFPIKPHWKITVHFTKNKRRLFFGNIPRNKTLRESRVEFSKFFEGVLQVILNPDVTYPKRNRGFVFVEFETHELAVSARNKTREGLYWSGRKIFVEWSHYEAYIPQQVFLENIPVACSLLSFKSFIYQLLDRGLIERIYKKYNYAFVHFQSRAQAELAYEKLHSQYLRVMGTEIQVEWAIPVEYKYKGIKTPDDFYMLAAPENHRTENEVKENKEEDESSNFGEKSEAIPNQSLESKELIIQWFKQLTIYVKY